MMQYQQDHIHLTTQDVDEWVQFYVEAFGAKVVGTMEAFGTKMVNLDMGGAPLRISNSTGVEKGLSQERGEAVLPEEGYHHLGFRVDDIDQCIADLARRGVEVEVRVAQARPGLRYGFVKCPGNVRIELVEQSD